MELGHQGHSGCFLCGAHDEAAKLKECIACGRQACVSHRGDGGDDYVSLADKQGYSCMACVSSGLVLRDAWSSKYLEVMRLVLRLEVFIKQVPDQLASELLPKLMDELDQRLTKVMGGETLPEAIRATLAELHPVLDRFDATLEVVKEVNGTVESLPDRVARDLLPQVMREVDERLRVIGTETVPEVIKATLAELAPILDRFDATLKLVEEVNGTAAGISDTVEKLPDRIALKLLPAVMEQVDEKLNHIAEEIIPETIRKSVAGLDPVFERLDSSVGGVRATVADGTTNVNDVLTKVDTTLVSVQRVLASMRSAILVGSAILGGCTAVGIVLAAWITR